MANGCGLIATLGFALKLIIDNFPLSFSNCNHINRRISSFAALQQQRAPIQNL